MIIRLLRDEGSTVVIGWDPVAGAAGYRISSAAMSRRPHTWDPLFQRFSEFPACNTRITKSDWYRVEALGVTATGDYPPPPPPVSDWPPSAAWFSDDFDPAPVGWLYEYLGSKATWPHVGFSTVSDDEGGRALRLTTPAGGGGSGQLAAAYLGSSDRGTEGVRQFGRCDVRFPAEFTPAAGVWNWLIEWHEHDPSGVNSCAIGLTGDMKLYIQVSGGDTANHQYTHLTDTQVLERGLWYRFRWDILWSGSAGHFRVWIDDRPVIDVSRPTLLVTNGVTDKVNNLGLYNYHPVLSVESSIEYRKVAIGASFDDVAA